MLAETSSAGYLSLATGQYLALAVPKCREAVIRRLR
jgi:hypothetical protein